MGEGRHEGDGKRFIHIRLQNQTAMETIITLGVGKELTFTLGHKMAHVSICGCVTSWEFPCSLLKQTLILSFLYLHAFRPITDPVHSLPFPVVSASICGASRSPFTQFG